MILTQGRYLLFRRAAWRNGKPCCASFFPSMTDLRSRGYEQLTVNITCFNTMNTRMRRAFRNTRLRPRKANASSDTNVKIC